MGAKTSDLLQLRICYASRSAGTILIGLIIVNSNLEEQV